MANPIYQTLVELQSIDKQIKTHLDFCEDETKRLTHIEKLRSKRQSALQETEEKAQILNVREREIEKLLHSICHKLDQNKLHQSEAKSEQQVSALEKELTLFQSQKDALEEEEFAILEEQEQLEQKIKEDHEFLEGSEQTLSETKVEVDETCAQHTQKIEAYEKRRLSLLSELPPAFKNAFEETLSSHRFQSPLSFITARKCGRCHFHLDSMLAADVFAATAPAQCPGCKRLLVDQEQI